MAIRGGRPLRAPSRLDSRGDHRVAMSLAVLSLFAPGPCRVEDVACVDTSYPGFAEHLRALTE